MQNHCYLKFPQEEKPGFFSYQMVRMFIPVSSLHFFSVAVFVIFVALPSSNGVDDRYSTCSSLFTCGNLTEVGYPFWGDGRPKYCGHPALQLQCLEDLEGIYPYLKFGPEILSPFRVLNITVSDHDVTLKLEVPLEMPCTLQRKDFGDIFQLSKSVEKVELLYKCDKGVVPNHSDGSFSCYQDRTTNKCYYVPNSTAHHKYSSCKLLEVPVLKKEMDLYNKGYGNLSHAIKQGFEVTYEYSSECIKCKNSGCFCGSSPSSDFACLCKPAKSGKMKLVLGIAIAGGVCILVAFLVRHCCYKKLKSSSPVLLSRMISTDLAASDLESGTSFHGIPVFSYSELREATENFDSTREIGDGGFGIVYYGKLRDGREVAVKRLYEKSYKKVEHFLNEVEILTRLRHPNLVTLYGCTTRHSKDLLLVYEYISNGTVDDHLHGDRSGSESLTWAIRMKIAIETASALSYLHTSDIVHRDVKTTNILLDDKFSVKVADFGLSRLFPLDVTYVSTAPQGTPGYLDPEYHKCYQVTNKSDVYSFGVVLVELISSLPAVDITRKEDEINLSDYAMNRIQRGVIDELVDQKLGYNSDFKVKRMMTLVAELAFQCLQQEKEVRPFMTEVLETLMRIEGLDYAALEADEIEEKRISAEVNDIIEKSPSSPSSVIDNWAMKSNASNSNTSS